MIKAVRFLIYCLAVSLVLSSFARDSWAGPSAGAVIAAILVLRPLGFFETVLGSAAFAISLPVTVPTRKTHETSRTLVKRPYSYTFERPSGKSSSRLGDPLFTRK